MCWKKENNSVHSVMLWEWLITFILQWYKRDNDTVLYQRSRLRCAANEKTRYISLYVTRVDINRNFMLKVWKSVEWTCCNNIFNDIIYSKVSTLICYTSKSLNTQPMVKIFVHTCVQHFSLRYSEGYRIPLNFLFWKDTTRTNRFKPK